VAVGDPDTATHLTWQVSGMGIFVHTALWGSAREAAQLWAAQREAGAERPCVVCWLGYHPPGPWGVLSGRTALRGGALLARHLTGWFEARERRAAGGPGPAPHTAVEAHSYGTLVAARALQMLRRGVPARSVDALVVTGAVGLPSDLARDPAALGLDRNRVYLALAGTDYLSRIGSLLSGRRPWTRFTRLRIGADAALGLAGAVGHNTSRHRPDAGPLHLFHRGFGYRDAGTASLYRVARATTGLPID
jgi:hypothetical protein